MPKSGHTPTPVLINLDWRGICHASRASIPSNSGRPASRRKGCCPAWKPVWLSAAGRSPFRHRLGRKVSARCGVALKMLLRCPTSARAGASLRTGSYSATAARALVRACATFTTPASAGRPMRRQPVPIRRPRMLCGRPFFSQTGGHRPWRASPSMSAFTRARRSNVG